LKKCYQYCKSNYKENRYFKMADLERLKLKWKLPPNNFTSIKLS
jgi:hypothetical protein